MNRIKRFALLFFLSLFLFVPLFSQTFVHINKEEFKVQDAGFREAWQHILNGDKYFRKGPGTYPVALAEYLEANRYNRYDPFLNYKIGICYLFTDHKKEALHYLSIAYEANKEVTPDIHYFLGLAYQYHYNFAKAATEYRTFLDQAGKKEMKLLGDKAQKHIAECSNGEVFLRDTLRMKITDLGPAVNSPYDDYKTVISSTGKHLFFTSRRPISAKQMPNRYDNKFEEDIYQSFRDQKGWEPAQTMKKPLNSKYNDAALALSPDNNQLFIYRGNKKNGNILVSENINGAWSKPFSASSRINSKWQETSITATADSNAVYFVSNNKKKSLGGKDIFVIRRQENGRWNKPENLDSLINTPYDEESPYVTPDGKTLYFCSQGHNSMGGYDVFKSTLGPDGQWMAPVNLGFPLNTPDDDLFYVPSPVDTAVAYISGIRGKTYGLKDIYKVTWLPPLMDTLASADTVPVLDTVHVVVTDTVQVVVPVTPPKPKIKPLIVKGMVMDEKSGAPLMAGIDIIDMDKNKITGTTLSRKSTGGYFIKRENRKNFGVELNAPGYLFYLDVVNIPEGDTASVITKNFLMKKIEVGATVVLHNIFFEFNKATINPASFPELNRVIKFMKNNPSIHVEIDGHTDNIGSPVINMKLSQARAGSVVKYMESHDISSDRLVAKGFGLTKPVASNDTKEGRAQNRRVAFKIVKR